MDFLNQTYVFGYSLMQILKAVGIVLVLAFLFFVAKDYFGSNQVNVSGNDLTPISSLERARDSFTRGFQDLRSRF